MLNLKRKLTIATASAAMVVGSAGLTHAADEPAAGITPPPTTKEASETKPAIESYTGRVMSLRHYMMHGVSASEESDTNARERTDRTQAQKDSIDRQAVARANDSRTTPGRNVDRPRENDEAEQAELETPADIAEANAKAEWNQSDMDAHGPMVLVLNNDGARALVPGRTAFVILPSDTAGKHLKAQCKNANGHPVKVTAREYKRGGLNLLVVESIQSTDGTDLGSDKLHSDKANKVYKSDKDRDADELEIEVDDDKVEIERE